jgi:CYTH domain-containing protein
MGIEIERKFLVNPSDALMAMGQATSKVAVTQGYLSQTPEVRVRLAGLHGFLTVKGQKSSAARAEYEFEVPPEEAREMLDTLCKAKLTKVRHYSPLPDGHMLELDQYQEALEGLFIAEVELAQEDGAVALPAWVGEEVTQVPRYSSQALAFGQTIPPPPSAETASSLGTSLPQIFGGILNAVELDCTTRTLACPPEAAVLAEKAVTTLDLAGLDRLLLDEVSQLRAGFVLKQYPSNWNLLFLFEQQAFLQQQYKRLFEAYEGSCCCADKARAVLRKIAKFYATGERIAFDYQHPAAYAYPTKVLNTHDGLLSMHDSLKALYHGSPVKFIEQLAALPG